MRGTVLCALSVLCSYGAGPAPPVRAVVLGMAQDGGVPHIGCRQERCEAARRDPSRRERVASLGLVDGDRRFLIDATPDLPSQVALLDPGRPASRPIVDGILLTHAHIGHYTGLMYLGREALGAQGVPVWATPRMARFLRENGPWSQLVALGNIAVKEMEPGREIALTERLRVTPLLVPHRDELSDTVGFRVQGPSRSLLYIPDIDMWERWERGSKQHGERVMRPLPQGQQPKGAIGQSLGAARAAPVSRPSRLGMAPAPPGNPAVPTALPAAG